MSAIVLCIGALNFETPELGWLTGLLLAAGVVGVILVHAIGLSRGESASVGHLGLLGLRLAAIACGILALWHPVWVREEPVTQCPVLAVVLDDSASMAQPTRRPYEPQAPARGPNADGGQPLSRYESATEVLTRQLRPALERTCELQLFDAEGRALDWNNLPHVAEGTCSPLTSTLLQVQRTLREQPLAGMVLLSDGREVAERPTAGGLEQLRTPVHVIEIVDDNGPAGPPNVAIQGVAANRRALVGNAVRVAVDLVASGVAENTPVPVSILDSERTVATRTVQLPAAAAGRRAELEFVPRRAGDFTYTVQVGALPSELNLADNRQTFPLHVTGKPLTVLYVDGVLRWEGKYVREALSSDPNLNLISAVRTAPPGTDRGSQGLLLPQQLANIDVVILGDVEAAFFSAEEIAALRAWVLENRGAIVLTGGYQSFGPDGFGATALRDVLPVEFSGEPNPQSDQPFSLKLTEAGRESPIFNLMGDAVRDAAFFQALPPLAGCSRIAGVKPGAEVLAVNPQIGAPGGDAGGLPVLVAQDVGAGRTMVLAVDTTWRWRMVVGGLTGDSSFYPQFWGQLVRWMVSDKEDSAPRLLVSTDRYQYRTGQTIELNVDVHAANGTTTGGYRVTAAALTEAGSRSVVPLAEISPGRLRGALAAASAGRLDLLVHGVPASRDADESSEELSAVATVQVERPDMEALDPRPDPQWLAQVAQLSGGRVVRPEQIESWAGQLPVTPLQTTRIASSGLAGERLLGGVFLALLCTEWILRRRRRLV
jgi:uncharacterized membrane protein